MANRAHRRRHLHAVSRHRSIVVDDACVMCDGHAVIIPDDNRAELHHETGCPVLDAPGDFEPDLSEHLDARLMEATGGLCPTCFLDGEGGHQH